MKQNETAQETMHFNTSPRRPSDPRALILFLIGAFAGVCLTVVFIAPWVIR